jgi:hypothetical protein
MSLGAPRAGACWLVSMIGICLSWLLQHMISMMVMHAVVPALLLAFRCRTRPCTNWVRELQLPSAHAAARDVDGCVCVHCMQVQLC